MPEENEIPDVSTMSDEEFLALDPGVFDAPDANDEDGQTPEEIEAARRAALTQEERDAEDGANDDGETPEAVEEARRAALPQAERDEEDRWLGLTEEQRIAENAAVDTEIAETARRKALTPEAREAEDTVTATEKTRREALTDEERQAEDDKADPDKNKKGSEEKPGETTDAQFIEIGKQIMGGIQANGQTLKIKNVEDAIQLIQMGANYHKKMTGLKPALKHLKLLENHDLLDSTKLNYLIDLHQKKPEAITQLLKDSKIDPMDIDLKGESDYAPDSRTVSDTEVDLDRAIESIEGTKFYDQTLTVIGTTWDDASKSHIAKNPGIIRTINSHMESGVYQQVADAVAYERTLGKLEGVSDFDAYSQMGQHMHENKLFSANVNSDANSNHQDTKKPQNNGETPGQKAARLGRKKAASPSRQKKAPVKSDQQYNPLSMSDEDYIKLNKLSI